MDGCLNMAFDLDLEDVHQKTGRFLFRQQPTLNYFTQDYNRLGIKPENAHLDHFVMLWYTSHCILLLIWGSSPPPLVTPYNLFVCCFETYLSLAWPVSVAGQCCRQFPPCRSASGFLFVFLPSEVAVILVPYLQS